MDLSIIIISHGHETMLPACISSMHGALVGLNCEWVIIDNLATGTVRDVVRGLGVSSSVYQNPAPLGFAANVNQAVSGDGNPLINASMSGRLEMAQLLVKNGAKLDAHVSGDDTPLINAVRSGNENLVRYLLDAGASASLAGDYDRDLQADRTPLNQATKYQSADIEKQLCSAGAY